MPMSNHGRGEDSEMPETTGDLAEETKVPEVRYPCPYCPEGTKEHDEGLASARALGSHLRWKHGIAGQSRTTKYRNRTLGRTPATAEDVIASSHAELEGRIAAAGDVGEYIAMIHEMSHELTRLWAMENQFHKVLQENAEFKKALEDFQRARGKYLG